MVSFLDKLYSLSSYYYNITDDVKEKSPAEVATEEPVEKHEPEINQPMEVEISVVSVPIVNEEQKPEIPLSIPTPTEEKVVEKEPSPAKEVEEKKEVVDKIEVEVKKEVVEEADKSPEEPDQDMTEVGKLEEKIEPKIEQRSEPKSKTPPMNGELPKVRFDIITSPAAQLTYVHTVIRQRYIIGQDYARDRTESMLPNCTFVLIRLQYVRYQL